MQDTDYTGEGEGVGEGGGRGKGGRGKGEGGRGKGGRVEGEDTHIVDLPEGMGIRESTSLLPEKVRDAVLHCSLGKKGSSLPPGPPPRTLAHIVQKHSAHSHSWGDRLSLCWLLSQHGKSYNKWRRERSTRYYHLTAQEVRSFPLSNTYQVLQPSEQFQDVPLL